jgi:hypothetical protein
MVASCNCWSCWRLLLHGNLLRRRRCQHCRRLLCRLRCNWRQLYRCHDGGCRQLLRSYTDSHCLHGSRCSAEWTWMRRTSLFTSSLVTVIVIGGLNRHHEHLG